MDLRDESGAVSPAEGCMFLAMILFAILLIGLLAVAYFRFQEPPREGGIPVAAAMFAAEAHG
jgi:hypothetical protein